MSRKLSVLLILPFTTGLADPSAQPPHAHDGDAVTLEHFVITASPFERAQADLAQATTVLADTALDQRRAITLGETLAGLPGLNSTWFGPGASRPIIRGLGGDRIRLLENGSGTLDASIVSPDHAVSVEPLLIDRIEVVRGPASLLYGGSAVGGVVNVLTHRIETDLPERPLAGALEARFGSAADERSYGGIVNIAAPRTDGPALVLHLDGFQRDTGDLAIPGYAEGATLRAKEAEHAAASGQPAPDFARDFLPNSSVRSRGGAAGLSWVTASGHLGFARSLFETNYGVPGHAHDDTVRIDLRQRRWDIQGGTREASGPFAGARFKFVRADYEHRELEGDAVDTTFRHRGHEARAELLHHDLGGLAGTWGAQFGRSELEALGNEAFLPPSRVEHRAVFAFEEFRRGDWSGEFGARFERREITVRDGSDRGRRDDATSLSAGVVWNPAPGWTLALSAVRTERAPNTQEAYAFGPHVGTAAFEIGDARLARERAVGLEASLRRRAGRITGELSLFSHRFRGYIHERPNGLVAVEAPDGFALVDPATLTGNEFEDSLAVLAFVQGDARFHGAEAEVLVHLHDEARHQLDLRFAADFTRAEDDSGRPLPRIPARRHSLGLRWHRGDWSLGAEWQRTSRQDRVAPGEDPSAGYGMLHADLAWCLERAPHAWDFFVRGTNLLDEAARPHPSFLKDLAPLPGRNLTAGVRWSF